MVARETRRAGRAANAQEPPTRPPPTDRSSRPAPFPTGPQAATTRPQPNEPHQRSNRAVLFDLRGGAGAHTAREQCTHTPAGHEPPSCSTRKRARNQRDSQRHPRRSLHAQPSPARAPEPGRHPAPHHRGTHRTLKGQQSGPPHRVDRARTRYVSAPVGMTRFFAARRHRRDAHLRRTQTCFPFVAF